MDHSSCQNRWAFCPFSTKSLLVLAQLWRFMISITTKAKSFVLSMNQYQNANWLYKRIPAAVLLDPTRTLATDVSTLEQYFYISISALISSIRDVFLSGFLEPKAFSTRSCFCLWIFTMFSSTELFTMNCGHKNIPNINKHAKMFVWFLLFTYEWHNGFLSNR